jgi:Holliday junction resolvasome RuvABC endonuclease subunit
MNNILLKKINPNKILAIDQAIHLGWAMSRTIYGCINLTPKRNESDGMKFVNLRAELRKFNVSVGGLDLIVYEDVVARYANAIKSSAGLVAIIQEFCVDNNIQYTCYTPQKMKIFATGEGAANKEKMKEAARIKLGYSGDNDNEADALWILEFAKYDLGLVN